jgi:hypothetical protein
MGQVRGIREAEGSRRRDTCRLRKNTLSPLTSNIVRGSWVPVKDKLYAFFDIFVCSPAAHAVYRSGFETARFDIIDGD